MEFGGSGMFNNSEVSYEVDSAWSYFCEEAILNVVKLLSDKHIYSNKESYYFNCNILIWWFIVVLLVVVITVFLLLR